MQKYILAMIALSAIAGTSERAHAYTLMRCTTDVGSVTSTTTSTAYAAKWEANPVFRINTNDFPTYQRDAINWAAAEWNRAPQARKLSTTNWAGTYGTYASGQNDIFKSETACSDGCAYVFQSCSRGIIEADVAFKANPAGTSWTGVSTKTSHTPYGGTFADMRSVALHELGHAIGLAHTSNRYNLMGDSWRVSHTNGAASYPYVASDDAAGVIALYGVATGAKNELGATHWRRTGSSGEYSTHGFVNLYNSAGTALVGSTFRGNELIYTVRRGATVQPGFLIENHGGSGGGTIYTRYYLSTNDTIGFNDTQLANVWGTSPGRGQSSEPRQSITIPASTVAGTYFIGIIVDATNSISEEHDDPFGNSDIPATSGNATYIPIRVTN